MSEPEELPREIVVDVGRLDPEGEALAGEADVIDLEEKYVHPFGGVRYQLTAQVVGTELLVRGRAEQDFTLVCSRCGRDFDTTIACEDFTESYPLDEKTQFVPLTNDIRESIILNLPSFPVCDEACPGIELKSEMPSDGPWSALDAVVKK